MATLFTTTPTSLSGNVYSTEFIHTLASSYDYTVWNHGDETYEYNVNSVVHSYDYPGTYQVSVTAGNYDQSVLIDQTTIDVDFVYRDVIVFTQVPAEQSTAGRETSTPFVISLTSSKVDEPVSICLYAFNSQSVPHFASTDKWDFLVPKWKFIDAETKEPFSESVLIDTTPLYKDSVVVGVSGHVSFYYIDDSSTGLGTESAQPVVLVATLSTDGFSYPPESKYYKYKSYSNPESTKASISWHVNQAPITEYKITENYLNEIYPIKWKNVPIPVMITGLHTPLNSSLSSSDVLGYPRTNELGLLNPITLSLFEDGMPVPSSYYELEDSPLYFKALDENRNPSSGYIFTTVTLISALVGEVQIGLSSTVTNQTTAENSFIFPYGYPLYAQTFVNNTYHSNINVIALYNYSFAEFESQSFSFYSTDVISLTSSSTEFNEITGTAATYGLAFDPIFNRLYALDADQDSIMYFDAPYALTKRASLSAITNVYPSVPSYVSIDGDHNLWVSMYNTYQVLKVDQNLNYLLSGAPDVSVPYDAQVEGSPLVDSSIIETDQDNNIWVSYAHSVSSMLVKFDSQGNQLCTADSLPVDSVPVSLAIDPNKNVWVCCYNTNTVDLYDSVAGQQLSSIDTGFIHPSYVALDREANVWFTHGYNFCSKYDIRTHQLSTWKFEDGLSVITEHNEPYSSEEQQQAIYENEIWAGLGIDVYNRVWVVDKVENKVGVFLNTNPLNALVTDLSPSVDRDEASSAQVAGDWTGNRWYQKYASAFNGDIINLSTPFRVYDVNDFQIAKINETFNFADYMNSLALPEHLSINSEFFGKFLKAAAGDDVLYEESAGRVAYERIANFLQNHGDVETAEIEQLKSIANQLSIESKTFGVGFPAAVTRLLNLFSVQKQRLRGNIAYSTELDRNIKELLTETSVISSNELIVAKDKRYNTYQLIVVSPLSPETLALDSYPLSSIELEQMRTPLFDNYYFHRYEEDTIGYKGNIIDWESKYTTISYKLSTYEQWYGDDGLVDLMFNSLLTKQMFLE